MVKKATLFMIFLTALVVSAGLSHGQTIFPQKMLAFAQVATGESIETVITMTNRGGSPYNGTLFLYTGPQGNAWNLLVNGDSISDGRVQVMIASGQTLSLRISSEDPEATPGLAILVPDDFSQTNFVEGSLTYFISLGPTLLDSVGVLPSQEIYLSSIPFENFFEVALALVNADVVDNEDANVTLRLLDASGNEVTSQTITVSPLSHDPRFLSEFFPGINLTQGRLDIESDLPVFGTALTLRQGQLSPLPLVASVRSYALEITRQDAQVARGEASLWAEGFFVKGYFVVNEFEGQAIATETYLVSGRLVEGVLRLSFFARGVPFDGQEVSLYFQRRDFSFAEDEFTTDYVATDLSDNSTTGGTLTLRRTN